MICMTWMTRSVQETGLDDMDDIDYINNKDDMDDIDARGSQGTWPGYHW